MIINRRFSFDRFGQVANYCLDLNKETTLAVKS